MVQQPNRSYPKNKNNNNHRKASNTGNNNTSSTSNSTNNNSSTNTNTNYTRKQNRNNNHFKERSSPHFTTNKKYKSNSYNSKSSNTVTNPNNNNKSHFGNKSSSSSSNYNNRNNNANNFKKSSVSNNQGNKNNTSDSKTSVDATANNTKNNRNTNNNSSNNNNNNNTYNNSNKILCQKIRNCKSLMELLTLQRDSTQIAEACHISFYWNQLSRLLFTNANDTLFVPAGSKGSNFHATTNNSQQQQRRLNRNPNLIKPLLEQTVQLFSVNQNETSDSKNTNNASNKNKNRKGNTGNVIEPRSLAVTAHAIAKISYKTKPVRTIIDASKVWDILEHNIIRISSEAGDKKAVFSSQECANIVWSFAKVGRGKESERIFTTMSTLQVSLLPSCNAQDIANTVWAYATANHPAPTLFDAIGASYQTLFFHDRSFDSQNLANTVWAYATLGHRTKSSSQLFTNISETARTKLHTFNSQAVANTVWAYASMQHSDVLLFDDIANLLLKQEKQEEGEEDKSRLKKSLLSTFNSQELAITVWAYATAGQNTTSSKELLDVISKLAIHKLSTFNSQSIANTVWAYATLGHDAPELLDAISALIIQRIDAYNSQLFTDQIAARAAAVATGVVGAYPGSASGLSQQQQQVQQFAMLNAATQNSGGSTITRQLLLSADTFNSQAIANTVWAYATLLGHQNENHHSYSNLKKSTSTKDLFSAMSQLALMKLDTFNSQEIANTMWAYATSGNTNHSGLFYAIAQIAVTKLQTFNSQEIANTVWAFATVAHPAPELFDAISRMLLLHPPTASGAADTGAYLSTFNSQEIANTIWAYATVYYQTPNHNGIPNAAASNTTKNLMDAILWQALRKITTLESEQIVNILWSVVVIDCIAPKNVIPLFTEISKRYVAKQPQQGSSEANSSPNQNYHQRKIETGSNYSKNSKNFLSKEALSQLHQASMWYSDEHGQESLLPPKLREECWYNFSSNENIVPSKLQHDVVQTFRSMMPNIEIVEEESRCPRTGYSIDVVIRVHAPANNMNAFAGNNNGTTSRTIAIEIDGPCHFVGYSPNGATMLKRRQFYNLVADIPLLSIPYWEWDTLTTSTPNMPNNMMGSNMSHNDMGMMMNSNNYNPYYQQQQQQQQQLHPYNHAVAASSWHPNHYQQQHYNTYYNASNELNRKREYLERLLQQVMYLP